MPEQHCILCGQPFSTGLNVMGCLICFPCEKLLLQPLAGEKMEKERLRVLLKLYGGQETAVQNI